MIIRLLILSIAAVALTGCLKTRAELRGEEDNSEVQRQTSVQRREEVRSQNAPTAGKGEKSPPPAPKGDDIDDQMRQLNGRLEVVENQQQQNATAFANEKESVTKMAQAIDQKFASYEEAIKKLEAQVAALTALVNAQDSKGSSASSGEAPAKGKSVFQEAEELFGAKKWKEAIVAYQKYRDNNPKGKQYADATYKIGLCFQELKMKDEAKAFFDEVTSKFPGSKEAKKAAFRSKQLK